VIEKAINKVEGRRVLLWKLSTVAVFLIAFLPRLTAIGVLGQDPKYEQGPVWEEWGVIAERVVEGEGYSYRSTEAGTPLPSAYMPPGYVFFILPFVFFGGTTSISLLFLQLVQAALGALTCAFVFKLAKRVFGPVEAAISAVIVSFYPLHIYLCTQVSSANLYVLLGVLSVFYIYEWEEKRGMKDLALIGAFIGLLSLTRAQAVLFIPVVGGWVALRAQKKRYMKSFLVVAMSVAMILPWSYRNYSTIHEFVPIAQSAGYNLWRGHNLGTRGAWNDSLSTELKNELANAEKTKSYGSIRDSLFLEHALKHISENPVRSVKLTGFKFVYFWGYFWGVETGYTGVGSPLYWLPWFLLLPFFVAGVYISFDKWYELVPIQSFIIIPTLVIVVFFVLPRYRLFIVPYVAVVSSVGFSRLQSIFFGKEA
jgi:4-amino-4-deoxy-L-arabinose transferase-like glycosyltransferase